MIRPVPSGLRTEGFRGLSLYEYQEDAWKRALDLLDEDLRFEHLKAKEAG
jgi:hypothetical protein